MPGNATVGSTLLDEELRRILMEREQECMKLKAMNTTPPPGKVFFMFENKRNRPSRSKSGERERAHVSSTCNVVARYICREVYHIFTSFR